MEGKPYGLHMAREQVLHIVIYYTECPIISLTYRDSYSCRTHGVFTRLNWPYHSDIIRKYSIEYIFHASIHRSNALINIVQLMTS